MASTCPSYTYTLTNGTTADATQVMGNFNTIMTCANGSLAPLASPSFSGNVGIGNSSPSYPLDVTGNVRITGLIGLGTVPASGIALRINESFGNTEGAILLALTGITSASTGTLTNEYGVLSDPIFKPITYKISTGSALYAKSYLDPEMTNATDIAMDSWTGTVSRLAVYGAGGSKGTITNGIGLQIGTLNNESTGNTITVTNNYGFQVQNQGAATGNSGVTIPRAAGVAIDAQSGASNNTGLLIGQTSIPTGNFGIYNVSANNNYFAGNVGIGTTSPAVALHVVGTIRQTNCTTAGTLSANASGDIICASDGRLKNILGDYSGGLDALVHINPKLFTYKATASDPVETFVHAGFIAQNVMAVIPQASALQRDGYYSLDTTAVLAATVNSVKQLKSIADRQASEIARLTARLGQMAASAHDEATAIREMRAELAALRRPTRQRTAAR